MRRRTFLHLSSLPLLAAAVPAMPDSARKLERFGLQLSTITPLMLADFEGTLKTVADIGYPQVEFSALGFLGRPVDHIARVLEDLGLEAPVGRVSPQLPPEFVEWDRVKIIAYLRERGKKAHLMENIATSLDAAVTLGQDSLVLPALWPDQFKDQAGLDEAVAILQEAGELCSARGVKFGYHNHNWELVDIDGVVPLDTMIEQTQPDHVTFQMDAYWIRKGGGDLFDYLARYPGRFSSCHLKDIDANGDFEDVGHGLIDFPRFTRTALAQGTRHFFVERDNPPDPASAIRRSYAYLSQMTF